MWAREVIGLVGVERFGVKLDELARKLGTSRDGVSPRMQQTVGWQASNPDFVADAKALDFAGSEEG